MPRPLKPGYNFNFERCRRPPCFEMAAAEAYTDFYAVSYMLRGEILVYSPKFTTVIQPGDLAFTHKNVYCRSGCISDTPRENILIKFTDAMVAEVIEILGLKDFNDLYRENPYLHLEKDSQDKVLAILAEMEQEWNAYDEYSELILKGLLHRLIVLCLKESAKGGMHHLTLRTPPDCLTEAIEYINSHLRDSLTLEAVANHLNISASYLSKIFTNYLHTPFSTFVLNEKIIFAQKLLVSSELSMPEVATEAGFSSSAYFSSCFRRTNGMSPMQFRKKNGCKQEKEEG